MKITEDDFALLALGSAHEKFGIRNGPNDAFLKVRSRTAPSK